MTSPATDAASLLSAAAVRDTAQLMLSLACAGGLSDWTVNLERLEATADFVAAVVRERYPALDVPVHSRWRHFRFDGQDLWSTLADAQPSWDAAARGRAAFDLVMTSVLLDAGAGAHWSYRDTATGQTAVRSEGLALASFRSFECGWLADDPRDPHRVDAAVLKRLTSSTLEQAFQAGEHNPLVGLDGRAALLNRLGAQIERRAELFAMNDSPRPGGLFDALASLAVNNTLPAPTILAVLLDALGPIWEDRPTLQGVALGDCWPHPELRATQLRDGYVPLHKLSQWLAYSLIEPLETAGIHVSEVHGLTGLAEYRNGGLLIDMGVIAPRDPYSLRRPHLVAEPYVVGWRSLTVALLDRLSPLVSARLDVPTDAFPLARVLEGGTWAAGRLAAAQRRADGSPPFQVISDGTVF